MKSYRTIDVAYWFLDKASQCQEPLPEMTQMKLQKLVYFSQLVSVMSMNGTPIHVQDTQAWDYGPVAPSLYNALKKFKGEPLLLNDARFEEVFAKRTPEEISDDDALSILNRVWEKFKNWTAVQMSALSHKRGSAWERVYTRQKYGTITHEDMKAYGFGV